jgi:hypothetical protein
MLRRAKQAGLAAVLGLVVGAAGRAEAALIFYADRASWQLAVGSTSFAEDFEAFTADTPFRTSPVALNGMTIRQEGVSQLTSFRNQIDVVPVEFPPPSGTDVASLFTNAPEGTDPGVQVRIAFNAPNTGFGFDSWIGPLAEGAILEVFSGTTLLGSQALGNADNAFLGYALTGTDTATSVRFRSSTLIPGTGGEGFNIDNLAGTAIPEPSSLITAGIACLVGLGAWCRRRRRPRAG